MWGIPRFYKSLTSPEGPLKIKGAEASVIFFLHLPVRFVFFFFSPELFDPLRVSSCQLSGPVLAFTQRVLPWRVQKQSAEFLVG